MKAARFAAVGLVVAASAWIASGHLFPHETAESKAAVRAAESEAKAFRVVGRAGAGRAAQPQARALRPHRGGPQDDGDGARLRRRVRAEGAPRPVRQAGRRHRHPVRRGARVAGRAGARHADAAQGRARGEDEAGRAGHAAAARAGQLGSAAQGRRGRRLRPPRPSASAASCARPGRAWSTRCRSKSDRRRSRWPAGRSRRSSRSIRSSRSSKSPSASCMASSSAIRPRSASSPGTRRRARSASSPRPRARRRAPIGSTSRFPMRTATSRTASPPR